MKYISAEQFLEQPKEVQKALLDWWKPSVGDLYSWVKRDNECDNNLRELECCNSKNIVQITNSFKGTDEGNRIPLLTEGQLREFIEDKTKTHLDVNYYGESTEIYTMSDLFGEYSGTFSDEETLLEIYWQIACEVVKEESKCK